MLAAAQTDSYQDMSSFNQEIIHTWRKSNVCDVMSLPDDTSCSENMKMMTRYARRTLT